MTIDDLIDLYKVKKKQYGKHAYKHISNVLREAKEKHKKSFTGTDHEQSWRSFKGKNLEALIAHIIKDDIRSLGLKIVNGRTLGRTNENNLSKELGQVKRNLLIDYGPFGYHLPDVDIVVYSPKLNNVIAVISIKVSLRERIAQTGYWKIKLQSQELTRHIKVYFVSPDEDKTLTIKEPAKKGRAIVEVDTDGGYIMNEENIIASEKVKMFDAFISDLKEFA